jgi:hypothetical protein
MMFDLFLVSVAVLSMGFALWVARATMGNTFAFTPYLLFVLGSILFINAGFVLFYFDYRTEPWAAHAVLSVSIGLLFTAFGALAGMRWLYRARKWQDALRKPLQADLSYPVALGAAAFVLGTVCLYFALLGYVPLFEGIRTLLTQGFVAGLVNTFRIGRDVYVNPNASYIPLQGLMEVIRYFGLPIVGIWFLHFARQGRHPFFSRGIFSLCLLFSVLTGQRWPLLHFLIALLIYYSWSLPAVQFRRVLVRMGLVAAIIGIVLSALLGRTQQAGLGYGEMFLFGAGDLAKRVLVGNVSVPFWSYEIFPDREGLLLGWSWIQNLLAYLPGQYASYPVTFYQLVTGDAKGFTAPPDFYTEAYINLHLPGVMLLSFLWGMLLIGLQRIVAENHPSVLWRGILSLLVAEFSISASSGAVFLLGSVIVMIMLLFVVIVLTQAFSVAGKPAWARRGG